MLDGQLTGAGLMFNGGDGRDTLFGSQFERADLSQATLSGIDEIKGFAGGLILTAGQLTALDAIDSGNIQLAHGGTVDLSGTAIRAPSLYLAFVKATTLTLAASTLDTASGTLSVFSGTVFGGKNDDRLTLVAGTSGVSETGITLNGWSGDDTLISAVGNPDFSAFYGSTVLIGGEGRDELYASSYISTFKILAASDVVAGEVYQGTLGPLGYGGTYMDGTTVATLTDFSQVTLSAIDTFVGFSGGLVLTVGQLAHGRFDTGRLTVADGGDIGDISVSGDALKLSDFGNRVGLANYSSEGFDGTVTGGAGDDNVDIFAFGYHAGAPYADVRLFGRGGNDNLNVDIGNATLSGGSGNDTLSGGYESSTLMTGGEGDDVFRINFLDGGTDRITDFSGLRTDLVGDVIAFADRNRPEPINYIGAHGFYGTGALEIRYSQQKGMLVMDRDGDGHADGTIVLTGMTDATDLTQADFL
ncbi:MAG: hypothetical protein H7245_24040 [Candidatus Saccharibacteria bacterium]|nr:hypothetical protein [Pseudorhodobacter sp.]